MYQNLFDNNHKFSITSSTEIIKDKPKLQYRPTGEYECGILCQKCDNDILGRYESYGAKTIYATDLPIDKAPKITYYQNKHGQKWGSCENVNYKKFKLFLLSILWRASVSTRPLFKEINLGPDQDKLKEMILTDNPGDESEFPIQIWTTAHDKTIPNDLILQPRALELEEGLLYVFPITGMFYFYYVLSKTADKKILDHTIKKDNTLKIMYIPQGQGMDFIAKYLGIGKT